MVLDEVQKKEQTALIESVIEKIQNNNFKIYIYSPPINFPSGGMSVLFKHAQLLKEAGYNVVIAYEPREDAKATYAESMKAKVRVSIYEKFNPTWIGKDLEGITLQCLGEGKIKFTDGTTMDVSPLTVAPEDFLIIPEGFPNIMENTAQLPCKRIVFAQSWYYVLNHMQPGQKWQNFGINDVISISDGITQYLTAVMPGLNIKQYSQSIDRNIFKTKSNLDKYPMIAFMPGRTQDSRDKTLNVIKTFRAFFPQYRWIRFDELQNLSKTDFAERLASSSIALYTDEIAGFGTLPLEAMACGTHVVGWAPIGGMEYMKENNGFWTQNGDIFKLAESLGYAVERLLSGQLDNPEIIAGYEATLSKYTEENEKENLTNLYTQYKNERINDLEKLK